jgi:hypothetical protein
VQPFDTWKGQSLAEATVESTGGALAITLQAFRNDIAVKLVRK